MPFPLSLPYPQTTHASHYGAQTANTNFCELDHQFSPYIAELINTLSNSIYIVYAIIGLSSLHTRKNLTPTTALPHIGLALVGLGSAAYHATILKGPQLADEIGMAVPTGAILSELLTFRIRDSRRRKVVYATIITVIGAVYVVHILTFSNWVHYPAFGVMVSIVGRRCAALIRGIEDVDVRRKVRREARRGRVLFLGAFALWLVDRFCCEALIRARAWLGLPWGWVLELHGWWHVGTGMGAFVFIQIAEFLMEGAKGDPGRRLSPFRLGSGEVEGDGGEEMREGEANGRAGGVVNGHLDGQVVGSANGKVGKRGKRM